MSLPSKTVLITGANAGIGKELARVMARDDTVGLIYLTFRSDTKGAVTIQHLTAITGKSKFKPVIADMCDLDSVRRAVSAVSDPIDLLFMNAGGAVGPKALTLTKDGVTETFAANTLGHVVLLEGLIDAHKVTSSAVAVLVGSEAARGVGFMGFKKPVFVSSSADEFASIIDGSAFRQRPADVMLAYAQVKYIGAMWMAALARKQPNLKLITVSPGNTKGTEAANNLPWLVRFVINYIAFPIVLPLMGQVHSLGQGTMRLVNAANDPTVPSGAFYASRQGVTGPIADQASFTPDFHNTAHQDHAYEAVHRFTRRSDQSVRTSPT